MVVAGLSLCTCSRRIHPVYPYDDQPTQYDDQPTQPYQPVEPERRRGGRLLALIAVFLLGILGGGAAGGIVARATAPAPVQKTVYVTRTVPGAASPAQATNQPSLRTVDTSGRAVQVVQ